MRKIILAVTLAFGISGCAQLQTLKDAYEVASQVSVSPAAVQIAVNLYDGAEISAAKYVGLPRCSTGAVICSDYRYVLPIRNAVRAGRAARNNLENFYIDHPGALGPKGLYDALTAATNTINDVCAQVGCNR